MAEAAKTSDQRGQEEADICCLRTEQWPEKVSHFFLCPGTNKLTYLQHCNSPDEKWLKNVTRIVDGRVLSEAQFLMREIEELVKWCTSAGPSTQRRCRMIQQECQASIEEDGETLVIEGYRLVCVSSREDLRKLSSQADAGGC